MHELAVDNAFIIFGHQNVLLHVFDHFYEFCADIFLLPNHFLRFLEFFLRAGYFLEIIRHKLRLADWALLVPLKTLCEAGAAEDVHAPGDHRDIDFIHANDAGGDNPVFEVLYLGIDILLAVLKLLELAKIPDYILEAAKIDFLLDEDVLVAANLPKPEQLF